MPNEEYKQPGAVSPLPASIITRWPMPSGAEIVIEVMPDGAVFVNGDLVAPFNQSK